MVLLEPRLRSLAGMLFSWKLAVLLIIMMLAVKIPRVFCRYLCPLGAFYALFNRFACYQMQVSQDKCIQCGKCAANCPMQLDVPQEICSGECIRCGKCKAVCPTDAVRSDFSLLRDNHHHTA